MNALGLGAFDYATGATSWTNLTMPVGLEPEVIQIAIGVSNVADGQFQSSVTVDKYGSDLCVESKNECDQCKSDPMSSPTCLNPPTKSCQFYVSCMETKTNCGSDGYALRYGSKYCTKFMNNIKSFSSEGQTWVYMTMNCLQKALVTPLKNCENNCKKLEDLAFASHPSCYVSSGVCNLPPSDWFSILVVIAKDLSAKKSLVQALKTSTSCIPDIISRIEQLLLTTLDTVTRSAMLIVRMVSVIVRLIWCISICFTTLLLHSSF
ncbi:unnamed protein product [Didymodactylos carnosus]|nr:unnamed protein product [Didymodactylos carnosus]CAF3891964.1 unnamed protein product [Didymodactylos carnosus]